MRPTPTPTMSMMMIHTTTTTTTTATPTTTTTATAKQPEAVAIEQRSPWHSPVPYLFGGLAAMLGLIAFALLILACSYWRLPRNGPGDEENGPGTGTESEAHKRDGPFGETKGSPVYEPEKIVVIMAGQDKPSFLATPANIIFPCTCTCPHHSDESSTSTSTSTTSSLPDDHDHDNDDKTKQ